MSRKGDYRWTHGPVTAGQQSWIEDFARLFRLKPQKLLYYWVPANDYYNREQHDPFTKLRKG